MQLLAESSVKNFKNVNEFTKYVYANPAYISTLNKSTAIADHVKVDFELRGCPINKYQLLEVINAFLNGRKPNTPSHSVCIDCKTKGNICVVISENIPCLGPVTHSGCDALCPSYNRGCFGCFGPKETPNTSSLSKDLIYRGMSKENVVRFFRTFNAYADSFRKESEAHEKN